MDKKMTEEYVLDAWSYTEAEAIITKELESDALTYNKIDIARYRIEDVVNWKNGNDYYKVTVDLITLDETSGTEKRKPTSYLALAKSAADAISIIDGYYKDSVMDYEILSVKKEKKVVMYIPYVPKDNADGK